jgi:hypothetical protein
MQFHITPFNSRILISVNSPTENRQKCLNESAQENNIHTPNMLDGNSMFNENNQFTTCTYFDIDLTKEPIHRNTATTITATLERILLEVYLLLKRKGGKPRLSGIECTQAELA